MMITNGCPSDGLETARAGEAATREGLSPSRVASPCSRSQRDIAVLSARARFLLRQRGLQGVDQHRPCTSRLDYLVHVAAFCRGVWIGETLAVILDQLSPPRLG